MSNIAQIASARVIIGVDTHQDRHVASALDGLGPPARGDQHPDHPGGL